MVECDKRWHPLENSDNDSVTSNHETDKIEEDDQESVPESDGISDTWRNNCNDVHDSDEEEGEIREDAHSGGSPAMVEPQEVEGSDREIVEESHITHWKDQLQGNVPTNSFTFNAVPQTSGNAGNTLVDTGPSNCFDGLVKRGCFGPFPVGHSNEGMRRLPKSILARPNLVDKEWVLDHEQVDPLCKRMREASIDTTCGSIDLNKKLDAGTNMACPTTVMSEKDITIEIGKLLGIEIEANCEVLKEVMGEPGEKIVHQWIFYH
ncbi:hypothetical protein L2E82_31751 [Cichorium intybus]|uniref:Uncharacterized protein n=1 Tax=Cichorium intybus TaxID=13427 RepID=A0ACB9BFM8_CICIN|nr:hypothetical protein L2E82_31751 [Cichorium intybus]